MTMEDDPASRARRWRRARAATSSRRARRRSSSTRCAPPRPAHVSRPGARGAAGARHAPAPAERRGRHRARGRLDVRRAIASTASPAGRDGRRLPRHRPDARPAGGAEADRPASPGDPVFRARFERECRLAAALDHPNIVQSSTPARSGGLLYVTMRFVDGTDLRALLARGAPGSSRRARSSSSPRSRTRSTRPTVTAHPSRRLLCLASGCRRPGRRRGRASPPRSAGR